MDDDGNKQLSFEEFHSGIADTGLECGEDEAREIFEA